MLIFNTPSSTPIALLSITSAATVTATAVPATAATTRWAFNIYQSTNCGGPGTPLTYSGTASRSCGPPAEYFFASVLVSNNDAGKCVITFGTNSNATGTQPTCYGNLVRSPATIKQGTCWNFKAPTPKTFSVACS